MSSSDWLFALSPLAVVFFIGFYTRRYMRSVADFMSGGRVAGGGHQNLDEKGVTEKLIPSADKSSNHSH